MLLKCILFKVQQIIVFKDKKLPGKMTNRAKTTTIVTENEIEKCREESNWSKLMEIAETLKNKPDYGTLLK